MKMVINYEEGRGKHAFRIGSVTKFDKNTESHLLTLNIDIQKI